MGKNTREVGNEEADKLRKLKDKARRVSEDVRETTVSKTGQVRDASKKVGDVASSTKITDAVSSGTGVVRDAAKKASNAGNATAKRLGIDSAATFLLSTGQALLVSNLSKEINGLVKNVVGGSTTIYDKAMDAEYIATNIGGGYHRLFDGGHTIIGAFRAARAESHDDNIIQEALGTMQGLLRDVSTPNGLPLANWDYETYQRVADSLDSNFHIPKAWFYDLNTYDAAELLGSAIGVVAVIFHWNRGDTEEFAKLVGGMGLSAVFTANPLLLVVTVVAMARSFHIARRTGEYEEFVDGLIKGVVGAGATIGAISLVGIAGSSAGVAGVALITGLVVGILVNRAMKDVSVVQVSKVVARQAVATASEARRMMKDRYVEDPEFGSVTVTF